MLQTLFDLQPDVFFNTDLGERISLTKNEDTPRQAVALTETYFIEINFDSNSKFSRLKHALTCAGCEDELLIKYVDEKNNGV